MEDTGVEALPYEIWLRIFSFVEGKILLNKLALVCTQWRDLVDDEEVWEAQVQRITKALPDPVLDPRPPATPPAAVTSAGAESTAAESATAPSDDGQEVGSTEVEAEVELWDKETRRKREKRKKIEENRRALRAKAESWVKPRNRTWKWLYQAKSNDFCSVESPNGIGWKEWTEQDGTFIRYEGEWKDGVAHGVGLKWQVEEEKRWKCMGEFMEGLVVGEASAVWAHSLVVYEGTWAMGLPHGRGTKAHPKDGKYEGDWHHGIETGHGKHSWNDGSYYDGEWVEGRQNGQGTYVWKSGNFFTGVWENCNQIKGINTWFDGRTYDGEYLAGEKSGQGTYTWNDGSVYKGAWSRGLRHGEGRMDWPDGTWFTGVWDRDDRLEVKETNVKDWSKRNKLYDLYFLEDGDVWNKKYMHDIKESRRQKKLAMEEEKLKKKLLEKHADAAGAEPVELPYA